MFVSGASALALEVIWFRILIQFVTATTYAFTAMLAAVLAGIGVGSVLAARLRDAARDGARRLALLQLATSVAVLASFTLFARGFRGGAQVTAPLEASLAIVFPAALLMGASFPIALAVFAGARAQTAAGAAERVGRLYAVNTLGAIAGALVAGFLLAPALGARLSLVAGAAGFLLTGLTLAAARPSRAIGAAAALAACLFAAAAAAVPDPTQAAFAWRYAEDPHELWRREGAQTVVSVRSDGARRTMYLDGLHQASDTPEMVRLHRAIGHLGMVLHPEPKRVLVVGLGGGATPGAISRHPRSDVTVVELSESVWHGARFFGHVNYDLHGQPNVRVYLDDGRRFLRMTRERFDLITADIVQPDHAGAGLLYSVEYFRLIKRALADGGRVVQWLGRRPESQYKLLMRTFLSVFPNATLWYDGNILVGSDEVARVDPQVAARVFADPVLAGRAAEAGLDGIPMLRSWRTAGPRAMAAYAGAGPVLTDDRPLLEYFKSLPAGDPFADVAELRSLDDS